MPDVIICSYCKKPEYSEKFKYIRGHSMCRDCYKKEIERDLHEVYPWKDLEGNRPTMEDFYNSEHEKEMYRY